MTTKVTIGSATLYHGDCMDVLQGMTDAVDALITDPPYSSGGFVRGDRALQSTADKYVQSGLARDAEQNVEFSGDNRDARSWGFWVSCWLTLVQERMKPGGYALCFTDWRQLPMLTDAFQAGGFVWRGLVPWDKTESSRARTPATFATNANTWFGAATAPWNQASTAGRGLAWCVSAWTIARSCT